MSEHVYRARKLGGGRDAPKDHRYTLELVDEASGNELARCVVTGTPIHEAQTVSVVDGGEWIVRPNRRLMPSHWILTDPQDRAVLHLDQRTFFKLAGPLTRIGMVIRDPQGNERYRVVEPDASLGERLFGPDPQAWRLEADGVLVGLIATLPKQGQATTGWRGKVQRFLQGTDRGLVSLTGQHLFTPPQALVILMMFRELRDIAHSVE